MTTATTTRPKASSQTNAPATPQNMTAPFSVCFVGGGYRSAGLCIVAPMGAVPEPSNTLQSAVASSVPSGSAALWVLGSDNRIYPYVNSTPNFDCCWDLAGPIVGGVQVCLNEPISGSTSQIWTFHWTDYTITNAAAPGYFLDINSQPRDGGTISLWKTGSTNPNFNQLWNLQLAPQSIPRPSPGQLTFSPPVSLMFGTENRDASWGMNPSAGINNIGQCTVILAQNKLPSGIQSWVFGSDQRIYPWVGNAPITNYCLDLDPYYDPTLGDGTPLVLNLLIQNQSTQQWTWNPKTGALTNLGAPPDYFVDLSSGSVSAGNKIQIWKPKSSTPLASEIWIPEILLNVLYPTGS